MKNEEVIVENMLQNKVWAVIGANDNPEKYGNMIYKKLKSHGYKVFPVNPVRETVDGDKCYKKLEDLPEKPSVLNMVVSPKRGIDYLEEANKLNIKNIWLQPGTYDDEIDGYLENNDFIFVKACVLVVLAQR